LNMRLVDVREVGLDLLMYSQCTGFISLVIIMTAILQATWTEASCLSGSLLL